MDRKKIFFLSAILILLGSNAYGTLYPDGANKNNVTSNNIGSHLSSNTIISVNGNRYGIVENNVNINIENNNVSGKKILNIATTSEEKTENNGNLKATSGTNGVEVVSIQKGDFINNGIIEVSGTNSKGINITGGNIEAENNGKIVVNSGAVGVSLSNSTSSFKNNENGEIEVNGSSSKGIYIGSGKVTNEGKITIGEKAIGINLNGSSANFENNENGEIKVNGSGTTGAAIWNGNLTNKGKVVVTEAAVGMDVNGSSANFENNESGEIEVNGSNSKGIQIRNKGISTNNGLIEVTNNGIGVYFSGEGTFVNDENGIIISSEKGSKGIYLNSSGIATNKGKIIVGKDYINENGENISGAEAEGVNVNNDNASFTNEKEGIIEVTGTNSKGINIAKGVATNKGVIDVNNASSGVYLKGGEFINEEGQIHVDGTNSKGIYLTGGTATNKGLIQAINDGIGIYFSGKGTFTNETSGTVEVVGANSKGIYLNGGNGTAHNNGNINIYEGAVAIYNKEGNVINTGNITGEGTGIKLINGYFINSGEITTTGNAIESIKNSDNTGSNNTVFLKEGSVINGKIVGGDGVDILAVAGNQDNLNVDKYEGIVVRDGDATINNSTIALEYNQGIKEYLEESKEKLDSLEENQKAETSTSGTLTMNNSNLIINFKDSLTNPTATENPIIDTDQLSFEGTTSFVFNSSDGRTEFNINEALGLEEGELIIEEGADLKETAVWEYSVDENGNLIAKKEKYENVITRDQIKDFATAFEKSRSEMSGEFFNEVVGNLDVLETADEFTNAMTQMSGAIHGYTVDISALNSRNLVNTIRNRSMSRDYLTSRPVNSWTQDIIYLNNNQRMSGAMESIYEEEGVLGITEKQLFNNARLGFFYGGSNGKAKFDGGNSGKISVSNTYLGGYYNYDFNDKLSLNSNFSFVYGYNRVDRGINIGDFSTELTAHYPTYGIGIGTNIAYHLKDEEKNKATFYAGIDINRILQGNINENENVKDSVETNLMVKNTGSNEFSYYSITPSLGFMFQNTGYLFDKKYLIGADFSWETELGNIKDGKRMNMYGIKDQYKVKTFERENVFSSSIFGNIDLTESLALNAKYTASISDQYDADMMTLGMTYKMDTLADNSIIGPLLTGIENNRLSSDRWTGTFAFMFESEDDSNRAYYDVEDYHLMSGDYATSMKIKPKFTLNLRDKKSNWSYYFEGYYMANNFLKDTKANEREFKYTRLHGEARWSESYSKGKYGINIGYRNETADRAVLSTYPEPQRVREGIHQLRLTPTFTYNLGKGFKLEFKPTPMLEYHYNGLREGQLDFLMENEHYLVYTGFMPNWTLRLGYYREDRWMDNSNKKLSWDKTLKEVTKIPDTKRYHLGELRPSATYYFGNGDNITLSLRIPLGNGAWYNSIDGGKKVSESYETRYSVDYTHVVAPGFNVFGGITFLDLKVKNKDHSSANYGKVTRWHSFRPEIGFSYNF